MSAAAQGIPIFKIIIIGDPGIGKTVLLNSFVKKTYLTDIVSTIGVDFFIKQINIDNQLVSLQIWDTAGQQRFRSICISYFRGADGIIIGYDCSNRNSFNSVNRWLEVVNSSEGRISSKVLVATKIDIDNREVSTEEGEQMAREKGIGFFEVSSKNHFMVDELFENVAKEILSKSPKVEENGMNKSGLESGKKKIGCCSS